MILDPRKRFRESPHAKSWHDTVATDAFHSASEAALVEMQNSLPVPVDMATAAANDFRMQGARKFLQHLMGLTETYTPKEQPQMRRLNTKAGI